MSRPVSYNIKKKDLVNDISIAEMPDGHQGEGGEETEHEEANEDEGNLERGRQGRGKAELGNTCHHESNDHLFLGIHA